MLFVLKLVIFPLLVVVSVSYCIYCSLSGIQSMAQFYFTGAHLEFLEGRVLIVCSFHVTYAFQSESTIYSCLNVKELLSWSRHEIWKLSECNWTQTQNHLVLTRTLNHLVKLAKWLSCVLSTYLHSAFDCMFLSCHVRVSYWIHTL